MSDKIIVCDNVSKRFETERGTVDVIGRIDLAVEENEVVGEGFKEEV